VVNAGVSDDQDAGLLEGTRDLVGEGAGGEAARNRVGAGMGGELQDGALRVAKVVVIEVAPRSSMSWEELADVIRYNTAKNRKKTYLTELTARDDANIGGVLDGGNDAGSEHKLLPGLVQVEDEHTIVAALVNVRLHL
jgi:hypothetical protein